MQTETDPETFFGGLLEVEPSDEDDGAEREPEYRWLSELQRQCEASAASVAGQRIRTVARINACVAASTICGGTYVDPDREWFDAVQDLIATQKQMRRWENTEEGWTRADGEFVDRVNFAIRRWNERIAEPETDEEEETMAKTITMTKRRAVRQKSTKGTKDTEASSHVTVTW